MYSGVRVGDCDMIGISDPGTATPACLHRYKSETQHSWDLILVQGLD